MIYETMKMPHKAKRLQKLSSKQFKMLDIILTGNGKTPDGNLVPADIDQIIERMELPISKQSMVFSIRALTNRGLIVKGGLVNRRNRKRRVILPTQLAVDMYKSGLKVNEKYLETEAETDEI